jgi:hypothetical protein
MRLAKLLVPALAAAAARHGTNDVSAQSATPARRAAKRGDTHEPTAALASTFGSARRPRGASAAVAIWALPDTAVADATDDYPIPHRLIVTTCAAEQILAAARDFTPIYYERYMIDKYNKSPQVQHAAVDCALLLFTQPCGSHSLLRTNGHQLCRSRDGGVAQLGEDLLQQQGRCRQRNRPLRRVPTRRPIRVGLVARSMTNSGKPTAAPS